MNQIELVTPENVDLTNCDKEAIHIPGAIMPHGVLFALTEKELEIVCISNNTAEIFNLEARELLEKKLDTLLNKEEIATFRSCLTRDFDTVNPLKITIQGKEFNGIIHRSGELLILEIEPATLEEDYNFFQFYQMTKGTITQMQKAENLEELYQVIVREVKKLTGFDRVMIYQFQPDGAGKVVAETKEEKLEPFLGLQYPDSDIPKQAKKLYTINWLRLIPDINYQPSSLITAENYPSQEPLDLSLSVLRSVSPIHIEYLTNMKVTASMSISLVKDNKLWGLIACHHNSPKYVPYEIRTACEFFGQVMSLEIAEKEENENKDEKILVKSLQSRFIEAITEADIFAEALIEQQEDLLTLVNASGVAICANNNLTLIGKTPNEEEVYKLIYWLQDKLEKYIFQTNCLPKIYSEDPEANEYQAVASGLLALAITKVQKNYILWFRPEVKQTVNWAGNPNKPRKIEADGSITISPRQSFAKWQETVAGEALPWKKWEIEAAIELRSAIVGIILKKTDELAEMNAQLAESNRELDAFTYIASHDLKEPLRGIHNYASFLMEDYGEIIDEEGVDKLKTLMRLTKRMEDLINSLLKFSRLGRQELLKRKINLNQLVENVAEVIKISTEDEKREIRIPRKLPTVLGDRVLVEEVFTNLISNGFKYNNNEEKWVEIGFDDSQETPIFYVKDNGIGIRAKHLDNIFRIFKRLHGQGKYGGGTGAGLTIVKKIVERHGGKIWVESIYGDGSSFNFTLSSSATENGQ